MRKFFGETSYCPVLSVAEGGNACSEILGDLACGRNICLIGL